MITGLLVVAVVNLALIAVALWGDPTRTIVFRILDSDLPIYPWIAGVPPEEIAHELATYAEDCEGMTPGELVPYVREWQSKRGLA